MYYDYFICLCKVLADPAFRIYYVNYGRYQKQSIETLIYKKSKNHKVKCNNSESGNNIGTIFERKIVGPTFFRRSLSNCFKVGMIITDKAYH